METEPSDNAEDTEKSMNAIGAAEISIETLTKEADEATNLEYIASDKEKSAAEEEKTLLLPKVKPPKLQILTHI